jgi:hypothetical protein
MKNSLAVFLSAVAFGIVMFAPPKAASAQGVNIYVAPGGYGYPRYNYRYYPGYNYGYGYYPRYSYGYSYYPRYSYGYSYPSYAYGYGPYWRGHWRRHWRRWH